MAEISRKLSDMGIQHLLDNSDARLTKNITLMDWLSNKVIVCSYEKAATVALSNNNILKDSLVVIDEIHLATDDERALSILALLDLSRRHGARVITMSATVPNYRDLAEYLDAEVISVNNTTEKVKKFICCGDMPRGSQYYVTLLYKELARILREDIERRGKPRKTIVFRPNRKQCELIAKSLVNDLKISAEAYHSGIPAHKRHEILDRFNKGEVDVLVATHALAWGVNTVAERVVVYGAVNFTPTGPVITLKSTDIVQMAGRAGRPGLCTEIPEVVYLYTDSGYMPHRDDSSIRMTEEEFIKTSDREDYIEEIGIKKDAATLTLILRYTGYARTVDEVIEVSREWFNVPPPEEFKNAIDELAYLGLVEIRDGELILTDHGATLADRFMNVEDYKVLRPVINAECEEWTRRDRLEALAIAIAERFKTSMRVPEAAVDQLTVFEGMCEDAREVVAQLVAETGDTDRVAETLKKYAEFMYAITRREDYRMLYKTARKIREMKYNRIPQWRKLIAMYLDYKIDQFFEMMAANRHANKTPAPSFKQVSETATASTTASISVDNRLLEGLSEEEKAKVIELARRLMEQQSKQR